MRGVEHLLLLLGKRVRHGQGRRQPRLTPERRVLQALDPFQKRKQTRHTVPSASVDGVRALSVPALNDNVEACDRHGDPLGS